MGSGTCLGEKVVIRGGDRGGGQQSKVEMPGNSYCHLGTLEKKCQETPTAILVPLKKQLNFFESEFPHF